MNPDRALYEALRDVAAQVDPVPPGLVEAGRAVHRRACALCQGNGYVVRPGRTLFGRRRVWRRHRCSACQGRGWTAARGDPVTFLDRALLAVIVGLVVLGVVALVTFAAAGVPR